MTLTEALDALEKAGRIKSRWLPGMLAERWSGPCHGTRRCIDSDWRNGFPGSDWSPDLSDPMTALGMLLLAREAWGDPSLALCCIDEAIPSEWAWTDNGLSPAAAVDLHGEWPTESEAITAAIIAAAEGL